MLTLLEWLPVDGTALWRKQMRNRPPDGEQRTPVPPPDEYWTPDRHLLAGIADLLNLQLWQPTDDAKKGRNRPKPLPRPGVTQDKRSGTAMAAADLLRILRPEDPDGAEE